MRNIAYIAAGTLVLGACSSNDTAELMIEDPIKYNTEKVETQIDEIPSWYLAHPKTDDIIFSSGTAVTPDMQLSMDIAILNAKTTLADRINGRLSSKTKNFVQRIGSNDLDAAVAMDIQRVTTNLIADVDVAGYAVDQSEIIQDGPQYRAYVLLAYSDKEANKILVNRLRKDKMLLDKLSATNAYKDLEDSVAAKKEQDLDEMELIVKGLSN